MRSTQVQTKASDDDLTEVAEIVGVLKKFGGFRATCASCCIPLEDATQVMCTSCALSVRAG
jgi:hypothetical protein